MSDATVDPMLNLEAAPMFDEDGKPITYRGGVDSAAKLECDAEDGNLARTRAGQLFAAAILEPDTLLAVSPDEKAAHLEFKAAAQEARATQEAAQRAAKRYADAVRRLSEVCAPPTAPGE